MKYKFQIIKDEQRLDAQVYDAESQEEAQVEFDKWFQIRRERKIFGNEAYSYQELILPEIPEIKEIREIEGEEKEVIVQEYQSAVYETISVPAEYQVEITDISEELEADRLRREKIALGELIKSKCEKAVSFITGFNASSDFTIEQIDSLEVQFGSIFNLLKQNRIDKALLLLNEMQANELLTQNFIDEVIDILTNLN